MPDLHPRAQDVPGVQLRVQSIGYGHNEPLPPHDHIADLRDWFRDPHIDPELRNLTGRDQAVIANVVSTEGVLEYVASLFHLTRVLVDLAVRTVTVVVGCVGGRHRSVVIARLLADLGAAAGWSVEVEYLHVDRDVMGPRVESDHAVLTLPKPDDTDNEAEAAAAIDELVDQGLVEVVEDGGTDG